MEIRKPTRRIRRVLTTAAATLTLSGIATVQAAAPASAWTGSPDVDMVGFASCKSAPPAMDIMPRSTWVHVHATGEETEQPVNYWAAYWEAHLHTIPPQGSLVDIWIYCAVPGIEPGWRFVRTVHVDRPWFGWAAVVPWAKA